MSVEPDYQAIERVKLYRRGRAIVLFVIAMRVIGTFISIVESPFASLFGAALTGFLLAFLWLGNKWARILLCVFAAVSTVGHCINFVDAFTSEGMWSMLLVQYGASVLAARIVMLVVFGVAILSSGFMFYAFGFDKSVRTFMLCNKEKQKTAVR